MKKVALLLLILGLVFAFAACGPMDEEPEPTPTPEASVETPTPEEPPEEEEEPENGLEGGASAIDAEALGLTITRLENGADAGAHTFDHRELEEAQWGVEIDWDEQIGDRLMIQADVPLYEFAVIVVENDILEDEIVFIPGDAFGMIEVLLPGEAFIINSYMGLGTFPWSGITFLDENGQRWFFTINQNMSGEGAPYILWGFEDRSDEL
ncbi:MAG: hypothetical protein FWD84_01025 [Oscillospiraceae bacterium]|nr:hypothetical protein [Oscillospiraceae bacterium]